MLGSNGSASTLRKELRSHYHGQSVRRSPSPQQLTKDGWDIASRIRPDTSAQQAKAAEWLLRNPTIDHAEAAAKEASMSSNIAESQATRRIQRGGHVKEQHG